tara:strand:+ start:300 stop:1430 length:1131 start_codon:yes stop_codon:yes gene_type:complete
MNYLNTIEKLSKSTGLHQGDVLQYLKEVLQSSSETLGCERTNAWLFNEGQTILESLLSYNGELNSFKKEPSINQIDVPNYFEFLKKNELIIANDALTEKMNEELVESYIMPNQISSMIDVPIRSGGEMIGVVCFEHVDNKVEWTEYEKNFTLSIAQLISLSIETDKKNKYRTELEKMLVQKEVLLKEINHRVKNNLSVILSLLNLQYYKSKDDYHSSLFSDLKEKIYSISAVQNQLHSSENYKEINFSSYINDLARNLYNSYCQDIAVELSLDLEDVLVPLDVAIPLGLISNEVLTNSFKYAFSCDNETKNQLNIVLKNFGKEIELRFQDNGIGYNKETIKKGMGIELIEDLVQQIDGAVEFNTALGVEVIIRFNC